VVGGEEAGDEEGIVGRGGGGLEGVGRACMGTKRNEGQK